MSTVRADTELVPLSQRVTAMTLVRSVVAIVLTVLAVLVDVPRPTALLASTAGYLAVAGLLSLVALARARRAGVYAFGLCLLLDGVYLQGMHELLGPQVPVLGAVAVELVAVCLLASFRSGLKLAIWQSLLMVLALRAQQSGLLAMPAWSGGVDRELLLAGDIVLLLVVVLTASTAAALNERELRRRRYDAEALQRFATAAHADVRPDQVVDRLRGFVSEELGVTRSLLCARGSQGHLHRWDGGPGRSLGDRPGDPLADAPSELLSRPAGAHGEILAMRLDPAADPWLADQLPGARRLIVVPLPVALTDDPTPVERLWLVAEHGARRGSRVERRVVGAAGQAVATASLALSRARLLQLAEQAAATDGLTGLANRRRFDLLLDELVDRHARSGEPFSLVLLDVDHFKSVNDVHGHQVGDQVLQDVARVLEGIRVADVVPARYGGEEFAVLVPSEKSPAAGLAERLRVALRAYPSAVPVTASFGVAGLPADALDGTGLVAAADAALLTAKAAGRDRVVEAATLVDVRLPQQRLNLAGPAADTQRNHDLSPGEPTC